MASGGTTAATTSSSSPSSSSHSSVSSGASGAEPAKDGDYFLGQLDLASKRLAELCTEFDPETLGEGVQLSEEIEGRVRASIGKAQLLIHKRFPQFQGLCRVNKDASAALSARDSDLEGFWDFISFSIKDVLEMFQDLASIRARGWTLDPSASTAPYTASSHPDPHSSSSSSSSSSGTASRVPSARPKSATALSTHANHSSSTSHPASTTATSATSGHATHPAASSTSSSTFVSASASVPPGPGPRGTKTSARPASSKLREAIAQRRAAMQAGAGAGEERKEEDGERRREGTEKEQGSAQGGGQREGEGGAKRE